MKDLIFSCKKCGHELYVTKKISKIISLLDYDCPNCGEVEENWILTGQGDYFERGKNNITN